MPMWISECHIVAHTIQNLGGFSQFAIEFPHNAILLRVKEKNTKNTVMSFHAHSG